MTHREKMLHHLAEMERVMIDLDAWERIAQEYIQKKYIQPLLDKGETFDQEQIMLFHLRRIGEKKLAFQRAVKARDRHLAMAQVYGIAALVDPHGGRVIG